MGSRYSERYTDIPKGYLTYPYSGDRNSIGLSSVLLTERQTTRYKVETGHISIDEKIIGKSLWKELEKIGCKVSTQRQLRITGRKYLTENKIPVEIRKIINNKNLSAIRIRITGDTEGKLLENINAIKRYLEMWQIKPTECVWSQGNWKEETTEENKKVVNQEDILKEQQRLKNIVADMQDKIRDLEKPLISKTIQNERKAKADVLN